MDKKRLLSYLSDQGFDQKIIQAFARVAREDFVDKKFLVQAYENIALPLRSGATISQPYTIAFMLQLLEVQAGQKILEIGSGCGYVLALINHLASGLQIYGLEIHQDLAEQSQDILKSHLNIKVIWTNGFSGYAPAAPYDRILVSASARQMPTNLYRQLKEAGILVCPVGESIWQIKKNQDQISQREFPGFVFVPLRK